MIGLTASTGANVPEALFPTTDDDVFAITSRGEAEVKASATTLEPLPLQLLVLVDGKRTLGAIRQHLGAPSADALAPHVTALLRDGMICLATPVAADTIEFDMPGLVADASASRGRASDSEVDSGARSLREHGYFVRIARRPANAPALPAGRKPVVVVVEDEQHLQKFLRHLLTFEGFDVRTAANRAEIVEALREPPVPDLVLLDVVLPDADGFDVLAKMRLHPALQTVPIIMITSRATREAVLQGLAGGADGYITKPFQPDVLSRAIRTIFGIAQAPGSRDVWKQDDERR